MTATRITFSSVASRVWRSLRDYGALALAVVTGSRGTYADPDRDRARFLADLPSPPGH